MPTLNEIIDNYKTICCQAESVQNGVIDYECKKCGADVTMDFYYYVDSRV